MIHKTDAILILLTYRGKVLLKQHEPNPTNINSNWFCIGGTKKTNESYEEAISRKVEGETSIKLKTIEFLSSLSYNDRKKYFYHAKLSDENVNNIKREEGQMLQFFTPKELRKLSLATSTQLFLEKHKSIIEVTPTN